MGGVESAFCGSVAGRRGSATSSSPFLTRLQLHSICDSQYLLDLVTNSHTSHSQPYLAPFCLTPYLDRTRLAEIMTLDGSWIMR